MKKIYVKTESGSLVLATEAQISDASIEKFTLGEDTPAPIQPVDPVAELTGLVRDMAGDIRGTVDTMKESLEAFKKAQEKGFPIAGGGLPKAPEEVDETKAFLGNYDLACQGKRLTDKFIHPSHIIDEKTRVELAKYYALFLRSAVFQEPEARELFRRTYGVKTAVGDTGNIFPLPDIVETEILAFARESSVVLQYARVWPMTSDKQSFPAENASATVSWGNTTSQSDPGITEVELDANELSAYTVVKNATLADARSDIVSWLTENMAESAGQELDNQAFNGTGTPFFGILGASGAGYSVSIAGTAFSDITFTELSEMISKLDGMKKQGARFWMNGEIVHYVRTLKDDQNRPVFFETVGSPMSGTIMGYPYSEVIKMPSTTGTNTAFLAFGNLRYFAVGRRLDSAALSVDPYGLWTTNRTRYKLYQRWAMKVGLGNGLVRALTGS
jgi:HK97 family phage major capsid protein